MSKKKKRKQQYSVSPEEIQLIEKDLGVKFIDFYKGIFKSNGIVWKPVKNGIELLCAAWDNVPIYKSHQDVPHANSFLWSGNHKMQSK